MTEPVRIRAVPFERERVARALTLVASTFSSVIFPSFSVLRPPEFATRMSNPPSLSSTVREQPCQSGAMVTVAATVLTRFFADQRFGLVPLASCVGP